jgi:hypothetical protein
MAGRPRIYDNVDELDKAIRLYLSKNKTKLTVTGLALHLGFESRQSFYDYEKDGEFSYTIKKARLTIEAFYEENLLSRNAPGAIFALKNFGWSDKQELEHSGNMAINWHEEKTYEAKP